MEWIDYIAATLFTLLGAGCLLGVVIGVPGTWIMIVLAVILEFVQPLWAPAGSPYMFSIWPKTIRPRVFPSAPIGTTHLSSNSPPSFQATMSRW